MKIGKTLPWGLLRIGVVGRPAEGGPWERKTIKLNKKINIVKKCTNYTFFVSFEI